MKFNVLCFCLCVLCVFVVNPSFASPLEERIQGRVKQAGAETVGVYYEGYDGKVFTFHADEVFHAASTMKVPVMMEVFREAEQGRLKLDLPVEIKNEFHSIIDGSVFALDPVDEDSDKEIYGMIGKTLTVRQLVERMITQSSNLATDLVIQKVPPQNVQALMKEIGANDMTVLRGVQDLKAYEAGKINTTSARSLALCYKAILDPKYFTRASRDAMIGILLAQHFRSEIPAGIRADERGLKVANKDGEIEGILHDSAIIQNAKGLSAVLVVLTRGVKDPAAAKTLVAGIAGEVYDFLNR
jgi:beta-lactamase class A